MRTAPLATASAVHVGSVRVRRGSNLLVIKICALCCLAKIPQSVALAALPSTPRVPSSLLAALHSSSLHVGLSSSVISASSRRLQPSYSWSAGACYPASWSLASDSRLKLSRNIFRPLARMAGGASTTAHAQATEGKGEGEAEGEEAPLTNFATAKTPVMNPDVTEYQTKLDEKAERVRELLGEYLKVPLHVQPSKPLNYRMRAEFRIWHVGDDCHYAIFDPQTKKPIFVEQYPLACERINEVMADLQEAFKEDRMIAHKIFQVEFVASTSGEALVCLVYRKKLDDDWMGAAQKLAAKLSARGTMCHVVGRSKGKKVVVGGDHVVQWQEIDGKSYPQWQTENRFSQSNAGICNAMQTWVLDQLKGPDGKRASDILELYCGNGNFSLPLASIFRKVLATELDKFSVRAAVACAKDIAVDNLQLAFLSAQETAEAFDKVRSFRRLQDAGVDLDTYDIKSILVDPPRAGLDQASLALTQKYDEIVYISCNPTKLRSELESFTESGHAIVSAALFDQFPWTDHAEVAVVLRR